MTQLAILMVLTAGSVLFGEPKGAPADAKLSYEEAYVKAQKENKPLIVLVGADWCAACKKMKALTIDPMKESGEFENVIFTFLDRDEQSDICEQVMDGDTLPQIIVFSKATGSWRRHSLTGIQSENRVKDLILRATAKPLASDRLIR